MGSLKFYSAKLRNEKSTAIIYYHHHSSKEPTLSTAQSRESSNFKSPKVGNRARSQQATVNAPTRAPGEGRGVQKTPREVETGEQRQPRVIWNPQETRKPDPVLNTAGEAVPKGSDARAKAKAGRLLRRQGGGSQRRGYLGSWKKHRRLSYPLLHGESRPSKQVSVTVPTEGAPGFRMRTAQLSETKQSSRNPCKGVSRRKR